MRPIEPVRVHSSPDACPSNKHWCLGCGRQAFATIKSGRCESRSSGACSAGTQEAGVARDGATESSRARSAAACSRGTSGHGPSSRMSVPFPPSNAVDSTAKLSSIYTVNSLFIRQARTRAGLSVSFGTTGIGDRPHASAVKPITPRRPPMTAGMRIAMGWTFFAPGRPREPLVDSEDRIAEASRSARGCSTSPPAREARSGGVAGSSSGPNRSPAHDGPLAAPRARSRPRLARPP